MEFKLADEPSFERIELPRGTLEVLADLTVRLTKLRQDECKHLCIENSAPELWGNLLRATFLPPPILFTADTEVKV